MGRPLKTGKPLTKRVELRMSREEYRNLEKKAKRGGLSVSEFLRLHAKD
jgi:Ribbon-helix-helix protein, copG family